MLNKLPFLNKIYRIARYILIPFLAVGAIYDTLANSLALFSFGIASNLTVFVLFFWILLEIYAKIVGLNIQLSNSKNNIKIRKLNWGARVGILSIITTFWIPSIVDYLKTDDVQNDTIFNIHTPLKLNVLVLPFTSTKDCSIEKTFYEKVVKDYFKSSADYVHVEVDFSYDKGYSDGEIYEYGLSNLANLVVWGDFIEECDKPNVLIKPFFLIVDRSIEYKIDNELIYPQWVKSKKDKEVYEKFNNENWRFVGNLSYIMNHYYNNSRYNEYLLIDDLSDIKTGILYDSVYNDILSITTINKFLLAKDIKKAVKYVLALDSRYKDIFLYSLLCQNFLNSSNLAQREAYNLIEEYIDTIPYFVFNSDNQYVKDKICENVLSDIYQEFAFVACQIDELVREKSIKINQLLPIQNSAILYNRKTQDTLYFLFFTQCMKAGAVNSLLNDDRCKARDIYGQTLRLTYEIALLANERDNFDDVFEILNKPSIYIKSKNGDISGDEFLIYSNHILNLCAMNNFTEADNYRLAINERLRMINPEVLIELDKLIEKFKNKKIKNGFMVGES